MADKYEIDIQSFAKALQSGQNLNRKGGLLTPFIKQITETALNAELDEHLTKDDTPNNNNGFTQETVKASSGEFELNTPRDRNGSFEPQTGFVA